MKLGVFGGSFDPPHIGHLIVAADAAASLRLDKVLFVPAGNHPLKGSTVEAPGPLRLAMIRAATSENDRFLVDERELHREGPSYTVDTLEALRAESPGAELYLLVGSDILRELHRWHKVEEIARLSRIAVMTRADEEPQRPGDLDIELARVDVTHVAISSTEVRERARSGRPFRYLVPPSVYRIITENSLYLK